MGNVMNEVSCKAFEILRPVLRKKGVAEAELVRGTKVELVDFSGVDSKLVLLANRIEVLDVAAATISQSA